MLILEVALAALLTTRGTASKPPDPTTQPVPAFFGNAQRAELAKAIKADLESISGPGSVDISIDNGTLFSVRIAVPSFSTEICAPIYDRELKLYRFFPDLNFDFYLRLRTASTKQR